VQSGDLDKDPSGRPRVVLPPQPERIRFEGLVELCSAEAGHAPTVMNLPVTLHAQTLMFDQSTKLSSSFDTTTSANYDAQSKTLRFCVEVMPGQYDVLATPPASMSCALFAERIMIKPPPGQQVVSGQLLSLPESAYLGGTLQPMGSSPLSGASVEAVALGQNDVIDLPSDEQTVTRYNRSSQTTTMADGSFRLPVDLGAYDVLIKPPVDSGFPWQVNHDVKIGSGCERVKCAKTIDMSSPVVVMGALRYPGASQDTQATLDGAQIDAFAIISAPTMDGGDVPGMRAVAIGKAMSDDQGKFMLLLPPTTQSNW